MSAEPTEMTVHCLAIASFTSGSANAATTAVWARCSSACGSHFDAMTANCASTT